MEAAPRLPMIYIDCLVSPENVHFGAKIKQYIGHYYGEDPETYNTEINNLEKLRSQATHPVKDVSGVQLLKKYYCQLHFLKSRFPMEEGQACAVQFVWEDGGISSGVSDIRFELTAILYNIGALHTYLGASDPRNNPEGMKMACTHFQCAAWAFQHLKEKYNQFVQYVSSIELIHLFQKLCLAQAQECILEKSMLDNRKPNIIAKVAVQVYDYYRQSLTVLQSTSDDICGKQNYKCWTKYLNFKIAYHRCISLLFEGQQAEEQQKMGERVAFYQEACNLHEEARHLASSLKNPQKELMEALAFTLDVVEGKHKAAKNENEFIYHEDVPDISHLQEVKGASLVKGIPFNVNDVEVSGPDIFARLVPMEAHEAASLYSEKKAQMLRQVGDLVEMKDQNLAEFVSSMQLDLLTKMHQATGIPQEIVDRAASLSARATAIQDLVDIMGKLSNIYQDVEANLNEIDLLVKEEIESEKSYQEIMGKRPPSIIATDLARESAKYREAHTKANESNQTLHRAMMTHVANLKILQQPLKQLQQQLPAVELPNPNIDEKALKELEMLNGKVEEMRTQRAMLWAQLRDAVHKDDITASLVTKPPNQSLEELFQKELEKHQQLINLIEQNIAAQENIRKAFIEAYANSVNTRRYIQDIIQKRSLTIQALITSHDSYEDLLAKANKGIEFYTKLETNVAKLLQRVKSASKVQQEEREQMLSKSDVSKIDAAPAATASTPAAPKLKDYLEARQKSPVINYSDPSVQQYPQMNYGTMPSNATDNQAWPPAVRPAPLGSETNSVIPKSTEAGYGYGPMQYSYPHASSSGFTYPNQSSNEYSSAKTMSYPTSSVSYPSHSQNSQSYTNPVMDNLANRMNSLLAISDSSTAVPQYSYSNYIPPNYSDYTSQTSSDGNHIVSDDSTNYNLNKAYTTTTNSYQPISSFMPNTSLQYPATDPAETHQFPQNVNNTNAYYQGGISAAYQQATGSYQQGVGANYAQQATTNTGCQYAAPVDEFQQQQQTVGGVNQPQSVSAGYHQPNSGSNTSLGYQQGEVGKQQLHVPPQQATAGVNYTQQGYLDNNSYFPPGYAPGYNDPTQSSTPVNFSNPLYHNQEYATSVTPDCARYNYSTYSSPLANMASSQSGSTNNMSTGINNSTFSTPSTYPNISYSGYNAGYATTSYNGAQDSTYNSYSMYGQYSNYYGGVPSNTQENQSAPQVTQKESNLDLLSGLDFTINQAPLVPQQKELNDTKKDAPEIKPEQNNVKEQPKTEFKTKILPSRPLNNNEVKVLFKNELEKYEKFVETLSNKTLSGPTTLDIKWKEIQDKQDSDSQKKIISVARCYPMKNRFPDILPYDFSRVELTNAKDDYINASFVKDVSPFAPQFIVTQAPMPSTFTDFWTMIREQQIELIFCLLNDTEMGEEVYFPKEKGKNVAVGNMVVSLQSVIVKTHWTERLISVMIPEKRESSIVMHLQFTSWPGSLFPTNPEPFLNYVLELISLFQQQRCVGHPVVVHCSSGIGRSGQVCLLTAAILDVANNTNSIPDLAVLTAKLTNCRRNILRDREHLKFAYEVFLCYMKQVMTQDKAKNKLNNLIPKKEEETKNVPVEEKKDITNVDPLSSLDPFWANKK